MNIAAQKKSLALFAALASLTGCQSPDPAQPAVEVEAAAHAPLQCGAPHSSVAAIQGAAQTSPLLARSIDVEGVVVGAFARGLNGVFIAAAASEQDNDVTTAEGLWIDLGGRPEVPAASTRLRVRGTVVEMGEGLATLTAVSALTALKDCGPAELPAAVELTSASEHWERYEGMRVSLPGPLTVTGNDQLQRFGQLTLAFDGRQMQPTERYAPGPQARALAEANRRNRLILDDARSSEFTSGKIDYLTEQPGPAAPWRVGSRVFGIDGVLDQRFGHYRIQATARIAAVEQATRPDAPPAVAGRLRLASFNVLNLFNGDGRGVGFPTARGATHAAEYARQRAKVVAALAALKPDIAALMELENDGYDKHSAVAELVDVLNQALGRDGDYRFVAAPTPRLGSDFIAVGLIYRANRVSAVGAAATTEQPPFDRFNRAPLAQTFRSKSGGAALTVVANHFKSKGGCHEADAANADHRDGQSCWNAMRVAAARTLADWLAGDPTRSGNSDVLILGDLNSHAQEDPLRLLAERGYSDAFAQHAEPAWSFIYDGLAGRLDHALLSRSLLPRLAAAAEWHINADEMQLFDYNDENKPRGWHAKMGKTDVYRSSDHDPLIIGLDK